MTNQSSDTQPALRARNVLVRGGRLTKFKGRVASIAPGLSVVATAAVLFTGGAAQANACGPDTPGSNTVTCGGTYSSTINYDNSDGLTLILNDPTITVGGGAGVSLQGVGPGNISVQMTDGTITAGGVQYSHGIFADITNAASDALVEILMRDGDIETSGDESYGLTAGTAGLGAALAQMDGGRGRVTTQGRNAYGLHAEILNAGSEAAATARLRDGHVQTSGDFARGLYASTAGRGAALAEMDDGTVTTEGRNAYGLHARIDNTASTATATARLTKGEIETSGDNAFGLHARTTGLGAALADMEGGSVTTGAASGLFAQIAHAASTAQAEARLGDGHVQTSGDFAHGLLASTIGRGAVLAQMDRGRVTTGGASARGLFALIDNTASTAQATARLTDGDIETSGVGAFGLYVRTTGRGAALADMEGGSVTTGAASGLFAEITNTASTATATAQLTKGEIETGGDFAHGVLARTTGRGAALAQMDGGRGRVTTQGRNAYGLHAQIANAASEAAATARLTDGDVETSGNNGFGLYASTTGLGAALADMEGGSVTTDGGEAHGLYAEIAHAGSEAAATARLTNGEITTGGDDAYGLWARNRGLGETFADMKGGSVTTDGVRAHGLFAWIENAANEDEAAVRLTDGEITTGGVEAYGLFASTSGRGAATAQMEGGTVTTDGASARGLFAEITNTVSEAQAEARLADGDVQTGGDNAHGLLARTTGLGAATAQMDDGTVTTAGGEAHGLWARVDNTASTAQATARLGDGDVQTSGDNGFGLYARTTGLGAALADMEGGSVTTDGEGAFGLHAQIENAASEAAATARLTDGHVQTRGDNAHGLLASTTGLGAVLAEMDGGRVTTEEAAASGLFALIENAASTAQAEARLGDGDVQTSGDFAHGLLAWTAGRGAATAQMDDGTVATGGASARGLWAQITNTANEAAATAQLTKGEIETRGDNAFGLLARTTGRGAATAQMEGGSVTTQGRGAYGLFARITNTASTAQATARIGDGHVQTSGDFAYGVLAWTSGLGAAAAEVMAGGRVTTRGATAHGLWAQSAGGQAIVALGADAVVTASGLNADGIHAGGAAGFDVDVAGSVTGGSDSGAAVRTRSDADVDGTIDIASTATVRAGDSGIAIQDGDGSAVINSAGTITGDIRLGAGNDTLTLTGGRFTGHLYAGDGDDTVRISSAADFDFSHVLDGGAGDNDQLILQGQQGEKSITTTADRLVNWQGITLNDTTLNLDRVARLDTDLSIDAGSEFHAFGQQSDTPTVLTIAGDVTNNDGSVVFSVQNGTTGDEIKIEGNYTGSDTGSDVFALDMVGMQMVCAPIRLSSPATRQVR